MLGNALSGVPYSNIYMEEGGGGGGGRITPYPLPPTCVPKTHNPQISKHKLLEILFSRRIRCEVCTRTEEKAAAFLGKLHKNLLIALEHIDHFHKWRFPLHSFVVMFIRPTALILKQMFC